jgi:hypothetical protein
MASKSLGTLTLDLVAKTGSFVAGMDKASRKSKQTAADISKHAKAIGLGVAAGVTAAAAGVAVMVARQLDVIDAQSEMAKRLKTSYESLTTLARAGDMAGVSMAQLETESRSLDVNLGKAAQGSIAQAKALAKLGLSAEEISRLPLDKKLLAINSALEQNISATERAAVAATLYGSRSQAAIQQLDPTVIAEAARQMEIFGLNLSNVDAEKVEAANDAMGTFGLLAKGIAQQLTVELAPILSAVGQEFVDSAEAAGGLGDVVQDVVRDSVGSVAFLIDAVDGVGVAFRFAARSIGLVGATTVEYLSKAAAAAAGFAKYTPQGAAFNFLSGGKLTQAKKELEDLSALSKAIGDDFVKLTEQDLLDPLKGQKLLDFYDRAQKAGKAAAEAAAAVSGGGSAGSPVIAAAVKQVAVTEQHVKAIEAQADAYDAAAQAQEDYASLVSELRTDEERLNDTLTERLKILNSITNIPAAERNQVASRIAAGAFEQSPQFAGLAPEIGGAGGELRKIDKAQAELEDWYATQLEMLEGYRQQQSELNAQWDEQELALKQQHETAMADIEYARQQASLAATEDLFANLSDAARVYAGEQSDIFKVLFAAEKAASIARAIVAIQTGIAEASALPFPGNLAAMASVAAATASIVGNIAAVTLTGSAHSGIDSVPETGTWMLKKGERVTTAETSAKLDKTLEQARSGMSGGAGGQTNLRIVNSFDSGEVVGGYLGSKAGERAVMNIVKRNSRTMQSLTV